MAGKLKSIGKAARDFGSGAVKGTGERGLKLTGKPRKKRKRPLSEEDEEDNEMEERTANGVQVDPSVTEAVKNGRKKGGRFGKGKHLAKALGIGL